jgi:hypothetical protein
MRKLVTLTAAILVLTLMTGGWSWAGRGIGPGDGTGPIHNILSGAPFQYTGDVIGLIPGAGMEIATEGENIKLYGIGPVRYWDKLGVDRPVVGDTVEVSGFTVNYSGVDRNVLTSITLDGEIVPLRDPATGAPLWKRGRPSR